MTMMNGVKFMVEGWSVGKEMLSSQRRRRFSKE